MHVPKKKKKNYQHTQDLRKVPEQGPRQRLALWVGLSSSPGPQKRQSMNTPKAYLPATRSQSVRVERREGACPGNREAVGGPTMGPQNRRMLKCCWD